VLLRIEERDPSTPSRNSQVALANSRGEFRGVWDGRFNILDGEVVFLNKANSPASLILEECLAADIISDHLLPYLHIWGLLDDFSLQIATAIAKHYQEGRTAVANDFETDFLGIVKWLHGKYPLAKPYEMSWCAHTLASARHGEACEKLRKMPTNLRTKVECDAIRISKAFSAQGTHSNREIINMMRALQALKIYTAESNGHWNTNPEMLIGIHDFTEKGRSARRALWDFQEKNYPGIHTPLKALSRVSGLVDHDTDLLTNEAKREANFSLWTSDSAYLMNPPLTGRITKTDSEVLPGAPTATFAKESRQEKRAKSRRKKPKVAKKEPTPAAGATTSTALDVKLAAFAQKVIADREKLADKFREQERVHAQQQMAVNERLIASSNAMILIEEERRAARDKERETRKVITLAEMKKSKTAKDDSSSDDDKNPPDAEDANASEPPVNALVSESGHELEVPDSCEDFKSDPQLGAVVNDADHAEHDVADETVTTTIPPSAEEEDDGVSMPSNVPIDNPYEALQAPSSLLTNDNVSDNKHAPQEPQAQADEGYETGFGDWQTVEKRGPGRKAQRKAKRKEQCEAIQDVLTSQQAAAMISKPGSSRVQKQPMVIKASAPNVKAQLPIIPQTRTYAGVLSGSKSALAKLRAATSPIEKNRQAVGVAAENMSVSEQPAVIEPAAFEGFQAPSSSVVLRKSSSVSNIIPDTSGLYTSEADLFHEYDDIQVSSAAKPGLEDADAQARASPHPASDKPKCVVSEANSESWSVGMSLEGNVMRNWLQDRYVSAISEGVEHYKVAEAVEPSTLPQERVRRPRRTRPNKGFLNRERVVSKRMIFVW
jgi:hypothetical protein